MEKVGVGREVAIVTFEDATILTPRGRYTLQVHLSFLRMQRGDNEYEIPYSNILEIFVLPKCGRPYTSVVITLDPSVSNGQTLFSHIVIQFDKNFIVEKFLVMNQVLYSSMYKDKLKPSYKGLIHEVFTIILQGFCGAKLTKSGEFCSSENDYAVESSLNSYDALLYPLENCFFFLSIQPKVIYYNEIHYVKLGRHFRVGPNMQFFDLLIKLKTHQEHLFQFIHRKEYINLFDYIRYKGLHIRSFESVEESHEESSFNIEASEPTLGRTENKHVDEGSWNAQANTWSGFMLFSQLERENVRKENPGIPYKEIARVLGDRWNQMSAQEKAPYIQSYWE